MTPDCVKFKPPSSHVRQVRSCPLAFSFLVMHPNIAFLGECKIKPTANIRKIRRAFGKCIIPREKMSPFLTCFPLLPTAEPYGQGNTRLSHISWRRLIMPLVALVQKDHSAPATSYSRLVLGAPFLVAAAPRVSSSLIVSASIRALQMSKVRIASHRNCERSEQYHLPPGKYNWRSQYNCEAI